MIGWSRWSKILISNVQKLRWEILLENWKRQIFEVARGAITAKLGRRDILNCDRFFLSPKLGRRVK